MIGPLLRLLAPLANVLALALLLGRRRAVRTFESAGAFEPATSISLSPGSPVVRWWRRRLQAAGVIRSSAPNAWWLDRDAWSAYRVVRRKRALLVASAMLTLVALMLWFRRH